MIDARRLTGLAALAFAGIQIFEMPLYFLEETPSDGNVLTRIMLSLFTIAFLLVFATGLRQLVVRQDSRYEWLATGAFGAALVYIAVTFVAHSHQAGTVIGSEAPIDATTTGPLAEGAFLLYGSIGRIMMAVFLLATGYLTARTLALPTWAGTTAYLLAFVNLAFVPSLYFGGDAKMFYSAVGWGTTAVIPGLLSVWALTVGVALLRAPMPGPEPRATEPGETAMTRRAERLDRSSRS